MTAEPVKLKLRRPYEDGGRLYRLRARLLTPLVGPAPNSLEAIIGWIKTNVVGEEAQRLLIEQWRLQMRLRREAEREGEAPIVPLAETAAEMQAVVAQEVKDQQEQMLNVFLRNYAHALCMEGRQWKACFMETADHAGLWNARNAKGETIMRAYSTGKGQDKEPQPQKSRLLRSKVKAGLWFDPPMVPVFWGDKPAETTMGCFSIRHGVKRFKPRGRGAGWDPETGLVNRDSAFWVAEVLWDPDPHPLPITMEVTMGVSRGLVEHGLTWKAVDDVLERMEAAGIGPAWQEGRTRFEWVEAEYTQY